MMILVIDDDESYTNSQCEWLEGLGYDAFGVLSKKEAEDFLEKEGRTVEIALVDMYMETEESGLELIQLMQKSYPWIVSVVVTAHGDLNNAARCMEAGSFSYISKGETPTKLIRETIKRAENRRRCLNALQKTAIGVKELREQLDPLTTAIETILDILRRIEDESASFDINCP